MYYIYTIILTILSLWIFKVTLDFINSKEEDAIIMTNKEFIFIVGIELILTMILLKNNKAPEFFLYYFTVEYLILTAYIDYKSKSVYVFINLITFITTLFILIFSINININTISKFLICLFMSFISGKIIDLLRVWGKGDTEIVCVISNCLVFKALSVGKCLYQLIIINIFLSILISGVVGLILLILKKIKLKDRIAFAPYLAISTILLIII